MLITICIPIDLTRKKEDSPPCPGSIQVGFQRPPVESSQNCSHCLNTDLPSGCVVINIWGCLYKLGFPGGSDSRESACNTGVGVQSLGREVTLEKKMTTHSSILAWRIPWVAKSQHDRDTSIYFYNLNGIQLAYAFNFKIIHKNLNLNCNLN